MSRPDDAFAEADPARKVQVMLVVLLVAFGTAILWSIVFPPHTDYSESSKVTQAAAVAAACRTNVAAFIASRNAFPANAKEAGCLALPMTHASGVRVAGGRIDVAIRRIHLLDGKLLSLQATADAAGTRLAKSGEPVRGWRCSTDADEAAYVYLPESCRQGALPGP
jgi:hypothetical protein